MDFSTYVLEDFYDEMFDNHLTTRPAYRVLKERLSELGIEEIEKRKYAAERYLFSLGITFSVYSDETNIERIFPFDIIPRIIEREEWKTIETGLKQRIEALNLFLCDVYGEQQILKDKIIPKYIIDSSKGFLKPCIGLKPKKNIWCHISGTDLVRSNTGQFYVLEDNLRCPSGVSYVLANREVMKRTFPEVFEQVGVYPVSDYAQQLYEMLQSVSNRPNPKIAVLTPGIYNSAYYEHSFLAQQMSVELVAGTDLVVKDNIVFMRTTKGLERVDVLYRRIDDEFLDPNVFRTDSLLGVKGIFESYKSGNISLVNAPGTGVADDKVVYAFVPKMIKYYLDQDPILPNVPTYVCSIEEDQRYVLENIEKLVVKAANESGGYGMLIGPHASKKECDKFKTYIKENPRNYIAQPTLALSRIPSIVEGGSVEGRHVDVRPYILYGEKIYVLPGGLTRVALKKGSLVVNSSQGGGSKDTWVLY